MSVTVVTIKNPLDRSVNETSIVDFIAGRCVRDFLPEIELHEGMKLIVAKNGFEVLAPYGEGVLNGDIIAVSVSTDASVAAAVAAWVATTLTASTATAIGYAVVYGATYLATLYAIGWGINQLVSALGLNQSGNKPSSDSSSSSSTYNWNGMQQVETPGQSLPIVFGCHRMAGQVISQFVTDAHTNSAAIIESNTASWGTWKKATEYQESDAKEYLNILLAVNDGEVDSISDIEINGQPISNYQNIETFTALGELSDAPIEPFGRIVVHNVINANFNDMYDTLTYETSGDSVEAVELVLSAPNGVYRMSDSGKIKACSALFLVEFRPIGEAAWTPYGHVQLSAATSSSIRKQIGIYDINPPCQVEVRITRRTAADSSFKIQSKCVWTEMKEIVNERLAYPGVAKYAIKALATDQLSGGKPYVSALVTRNSVSVYDTGSSTWVSKSAQNPAWAAYAMLNTYHGVDASKIIYEEFEDWADFCDETVDSAPRFRINIVFDTQKSAWENIQAIASIGQARVIRRGSRYGVFCDKAESTVSHLFSMGNIIEGTFNLQYLPVKDRANAVEVTYTDVDREYTRQVVGVYSSDYQDPTSIAQKCNMDINAAISRKQAIRHAAFLLNSNKLLIRSIEFEAFVDSFACVVGDLCYFQHIVPHYDSIFGGRIMGAGNNNGSGKPYVTIERPVTLTAGSSYAILVRLSDNTLVEKVLAPIATTTTTSTLVLAAVWTTLPSQHDLYEFGPATTYKKKYRIINITRSQGLTRTITLLEYNPDIYSDTGYAITTPETIAATTQIAVNVRAHEYLTYGSGGGFVSNVSVSWFPGTRNVGSNWAVWLDDITDEMSFDADFDSNFQTTSPQVMATKVAETTFCNALIGPDKIVFGKKYRIYVCPVDIPAARDTGSNTTTIEILGKLAPPSDVGTFVSQWVAVRRTVEFVWTEVTDIDLSHYEIREGSTWDTGAVVIREAKQGFAALFIEEGTDETKTYWIKAVDTSGIYSTTALSDTSAVDTGDCGLSVPTGLTLVTESIISSDGTDRITITATWDNNAETSDTFRGYEVFIEKTGGDYATSKVITAQALFEVLPAAEYTIKVRAVDMTGNVTDWCAPVSITSSKDSVAPDTPGALSLIPGFRVMGIRFTAATAKDLSHYELQRSLTGAFTGEQVGLGNKDGNFTTDTDLLVSTAYYYRVRAVDTSGNASAWSTAQTATTLQVGTSDIAYNAISANHIAAGAIQADHIAANAIDANKIAANTITITHISDDAAILNSQQTWTNVRSKPTEVTDGRIATALNASGQLISMPAGPVLPNTNPSAVGLYMNKTYIGYWNGSSWTSFIKNDGQFQFLGNSTNQVTWNGSALAIRGTLVADDITSGSLAAARIATGTIVASHIYADAIETAKIKAGAVETSKLATNSVTCVGACYASSGDVSVSVTLSGMPVYISMTCYIDGPDPEDGNIIWGSETITLKRGSTSLIAHSLMVSSFARVFAGISYSETPSSGTYTYSVTGDYGYAMIYVLETKR